MTEMTRYPYAFTENDILDELNLNPITYLGIILGLFTFLLFMFM